MYSKKHTCYQKTWCSNQKTISLNVMISILEISYEEEDVMFTTKLDMFSIGTIEIPMHIEPVSKAIHILDLSIA